MFQDYLYDVLDPEKLPAGRSIWVIDMKGARTPLLPARMLALLLT